MSSACMLHMGNSSVTSKLVCWSLFVHSDPGCGVRLCHVLLTALLIYSLSSYFHSDPLPQAVYSCFIARKALMCGAKEPRLLELCGQASIPLAATINQNRSFEPSTDVVPSTHQVCCAYGFLVCWTWEYARLPCHCLCCVDGVVSVLQCVHLDAFSNVPSWEPPLFLCVLCVL